MMSWLAALRTSEVITALALHKLMPFVFTKIGGLVVRITISDQTRHVACE